MERSTSRPSFMCARRADRASCALDEPTGLHVRSTSRPGFMCARRADRASCALDEPTGLHVRSTSRPGFMCARRADRASCALDEPTGLHVRSTSRPGFMCARRADRASCALDEPTGLHVRSTSRPGFMCARRADRASCAVRRAGEFHGGPRAGGVSWALPELTALSALDAPTEVQEHSTRRLHRTLSRVDRPSARPRPARPTGAARRRPWCERDGVRRTPRRRHRSSPRNQPCW